MQQPTNVPGTALFANSYILHAITYYGWDAGIYEMLRLPEVALVDTSI